MEGEGLAGEFGELGEVVVHGLGTSAVVGGYRLVMWEGLSEEEGGFQTCPYRNGGSKSCQIGGSRTAPTEEREGSGWDGMEAVCFHSSDMW